MTLRDLLSKKLKGATPNDPRPPLFIHAGLHKTGTTALQIALNSHTEQLESAGILYPRSGIPKGLEGHHNLAWQITRDRRFRTEFGTIDDAASEIAAHAGPAVLSSEDFETILDQPKKFDPFVTHSALKGHRLVLVIYLREQSAYFRSLFMELTGHGLTEEMARLADTVREQGSFDLNEWRFQFDYNRLAKRLLEWRGGEIRLRSYHSLVGDSTITDFLQVICPNPILSKDDHLYTVGSTVQELRETLEGFYERRLTCPLNEAQKEAISNILSQGRGSTPTLSAELQARLQRAFSVSNERLRRTTGLSFAHASGHEKQNNCLLLDDLFSFEMQNRLTTVI
jgi:hypothetical protein